MTTSEQPTPKNEWVSCPVCGETAMRKTQSDEGSLIHCVNINCASNGGTNADALKNASPGPLPGLEIPAEHRLKGVKTLWWRRRGERQTDGSFRWNSWEECSEKDARRVHGLASWEVRWQQLFATPMKTAHLALPEEVAAAPAKPAPPAEPAKPSRAEERLMELLDTKDAQIAELQDKLERAEQTLHFGVNWMLQERSRKDEDNLPTPRLQLSLVDNGDYSVESVIHMVYKDPVGTVCRVPLEYSKRSGGGVDVDMFPLEGEVPPAARRELPGLMVDLKALHVSLGLPAFVVLDGTRRYSMVGSSLVAVTAEPV